MVNWKQPSQRKRSQGNDHSQVFLNNLVNHRTKMGSVFDASTMLADADEVCNPM